MDPELVGTEQFGRDAVALQYDGHDIAHVFVDYNGELMVRVFGGTDGDAAEVWVGFIAVDHEVETDE